MFDGGPRRWSHWSSREHLQLCRADLPSADGRVLARRLGDGSRGAATIAAAYRDFGRRRLHGRCEGIDGDAWRGRRSSAVTEHESNGGANQVAQKGFRGARLLRVGAQLKRSVPTARIAADHFGGSINSASND